MTSLSWSVMRNPEGYVHIRVGFLTIIGSVIVTALFSAGLVLQNPENFREAKKMLEAHLIRASIDPLGPRPSGDFENLKQP
jgi:hypothetical protein